MAVYKMAWVLFLWRAYTSIRTPSTDGAANFHGVGRIGVGRVMVYIRQRRPDGGGAGQAVDFGWQYAPPYLPHIVIGG